MPISGGDVDVAFEGRLPARRPGAGVFGESVERLAVFFGERVTRPSTEEIGIGCMGLSERISDRLEMNAIVRTRLRKKGIEGRARVIRADGWTGHSDSGLDTFNVRDLVLKVYPPGGEPYEVSYSGGVAARIAGGYCSTGVEVPVRIDPENPERVVIDTKRAEAQQESLMEQLDKMEAQYEDVLRNQPPTGHDEDLKALDELGKQFPD